MRLPFRSVLYGNVLCGTLLSPLPITRLCRQVNLITKWRPHVVCLQEFNNIIVEKIYRSRLEEHYNFYIARDYKQTYYNVFLLTVMIGISSVWLGMKISVCLLYPYISLFLCGSQLTGNAVLISKDIPQPNVFQTVNFIYQKGDFLNIARPRGYQILTWSSFNTSIINTHLNHINDNQQPQIQELASLRHPSRFTLMGGDFNTENVTALTRKRLVHLTQDVGFTFRKDNPYNLWRSNSSQIDHIFASSLPCLCAIHKKCFESDHDALLLNFFTDDALKDDRRF